MSQSLLLLLPLLGVTDVYLWGPEHCVASLENLALLTCGMVKGLVQWLIFTADKHNSNTFNLPGRELRDRYWRKGACQSTVISLTLYWSLADFILCCDVVKRAQHVYHMSAISLSSHCLTDLSSPISSAFTTVFLFHIAVRLHIWVNALPSVYVAGTLMNPILGSHRTYFPIIQVVPSNMQQIKPYFLLICVLC